MSLEHYWSVLVKQWPLILACILMVGLGSYLGSCLVTPIYQSTVLVRVVIHSSNNSAEYNNLLASDQLVQTESQLAISDPVLREVATRYPGLTAERLARATTAAPKLNTQIFQIDVQDTHADRAATIANDIANTLIKQQVQETQQENNQSRLQLQHEINATSKGIDSISTRITNLQQRLLNLENQKGSAIQLASTQAQMTGLQDQLNRLQEHYSQWRTLLVQLEITEAQSTDFLHIVQPAHANKGPVKPQILLNTGTGLVVGLFLGLLLAVLCKQLDTHIRTPEDLTEVLDWPVLGVVWSANQSKGQQEALVDPEVNSVNSEAYRILRANLGFAAVDNPVYSLVVTSAMPGDGKSTIATNLAIFMAKAGKNILLIDADLHYPVLHKRFGLATGASGLSDAIVDCAQQHTQSVAVTFETAHTFLDAHSHSVGIPNLRVMPTRPLPLSSSELLGSKAMSHLLHIIRKGEIDMVIIDTPPLLGLADTSILTAKVDATLVVADITRAKKQNVLQVKKLLLRSGTRVIGCVVNKQHHRTMPYSYYYNRVVNSEEAKPPVPSGLAAFPFLKHAERKFKRK